MRITRVRPKEANELIVFYNFDEYMSFCEKHNITIREYFNSKTMCLVRIAPGGYIDDKPWSLKSMFKLYNICEVANEA